MSIAWDEAHLLLTVCEHESFSAAAQHLGVGQATVSRRIAELERRVGAVLFTRGRQGAVATTATQRLLPAAQQMARWAGEFQRAADANERNPEGIVRIAAPPGAAVEQLAPFAVLAKKRFPDIRLEILAAIEHVDLSLGIADLALRVKPPNEPELQTLASITTPIGVYASPGYAEQLEQPCQWADLDWVTWSHPYLDVAPRPMLQRLIDDFVPVFTADDYLVQKSAVAAGLGAMIMTEPLLGTARDQGFVALDVGVTLPPGQIHLVCAKSALHIPRVQAIADHLQELLASAYIAA